MNLIVPDNEIGSLNSMTLSPLEPNFDPVKLALFVVLLRTLTSGLFGFEYETSGYILKACYVTY